MNEEKLKEIENGCSAATPGPWWVEYREYTDKTGMIRHTPTVTTQDTDISIVYVDADAEGDLSPDAAFIANARIYVPMLIAEVRRLKSYGDMYRSIAELRQIERDAINEDRNGWHEETKLVRAERDGLAAKLTALKAEDDHLASMCAAAVAEGNVLRRRLNAVPWVALDAVIEHRDDISDWNQAREWVSANYPTKEMPE